MTIPSQPRPVVENAHSQSTVVRIIAATNMVLAATPFTLSAFEIINWNGEQITAFTFFLGVVTTAALLVLGQTVKQTALTVEAQVTPVAAPRDDNGDTLVPLKTTPIV